MPPKTNSGASKKTVEKVKAKIIEVRKKTITCLTNTWVSYPYYKKTSLNKDKTFGLKNKKGSKQQKFIQTIQKQVNNIGAQNQRSVADQNAERQKKKEEEQRKKEELAALFKPVLQTVAPGVRFDYF